MRQFVQLVGLAPLILLAAACGEDEPAMSPCEQEDRAEPVQVGMTAGGPEDAIGVTLDAADPIPPEVGDNTWTFSIDDGSGAALDGCAVTFDPRMPDHGHGTPTPPEVTDQGDGTYEALFELSMGGYWTVDVEADCGEGDVRSVRFDICAEM